MARVIVSVSQLRQEEKLILCALEREGIPAEVVTSYNISGYLNAESGGRSNDLVLIRNLSHSDAAATSRLYEQAGALTINASRAIDLCANKALQALSFRRAKVPQPGFRVVMSSDEVHEAGAALGYPYVIKPVDASWGRGVVRITHEDCCASWAGARESLDATGKNFPVLAQEYVDKGNYDIRVLVVGEAPIVSFKRVSENFRTNTSLGAKVVPMETTPAIAAICKKIVAIVGEGIYGVDLFEHQRTRELLVCEVNHNPQFARSAPIHGVDVAGRIAAYVKRRIS
jgi:[lysine-biosynthesis-protein LysW]---L-2-aminoadipate ligase